MNYEAFAMSGDLWELGHKVNFNHLLKHVEVAPGVTELDIKIDVYSDAKEWYKLRNNPGLAEFPIRSIGGDPTVEGQTAGDIYFMINGWRIVYDPTKVKVTGVLFSDDYDTAWLDQDTLAPVYPAQVASLVNVAQPSLEGLEFPTASQNAAAVWSQTAANGDTYGELLRNTSYNHYSVHVDPDAATNGDGSQTSPFNNIQDGKDFAEANNYRQLMIYGDSVATGNLRGFIVQGVGAPKFEMDTGNLNRSQFSHVSLKVSGYSGYIVVQDSAILAGCELSGYVENCAFQGDAELIGDTHIIRGYSQAPGAGYINLTVGANTLQVSDWHRSLGIVGMTGGTHTIEMYGGQLHLDATCTGGTVYVRGNYSLPPNDQSNGTVVIDQTEVESTWTHEDALTLPLFMGLKDA